MVAVKSNSDNHGPASGDVILGLSSIRFLCAFWVVMGHFGAPPIQKFVDDTNLFGMMAVGVYNNLTSGPAAVIVFFVISGLCIHYPHVSSLRVPSLSSFFIKRYVRIVIPMLAAIALAEFLVDIRLSLLEQSVLWSLFAELIYYTLYPMFLFLRRVLNGWALLLFASYGAAIAVASTNPSAGDYPSYGVGLNWVLGLPCWLLGCALAEKIKSSSGEDIGKWQIWRWRAVVFFGAAACSIARFHSPIGYPWTLNFFAILAAIWVYNEAHYFRSRTPPSSMEWAGSWSYSLYLVHIIAHGLLVRHFASSFDTIVSWSGMMLFILVTSYIFAIVFEFSSHQMARDAANKVKGSPSLQ